MIHYSCNLCQREIDPGHDGSYLVRMEVYAAQSAEHVPIDDDRDHLEEFQRNSRTLRRIRRRRPVFGQRKLSQREFHLCNQCGKRFLQDPLGQLLPQRFELSKP